MKKEHIEKIRKISFISVLIIFAVIIYLLFPIMKGLATEEGRIIAEEKLSSFGILGALVIIALEALKVFVVMLPGEPIELLSGMCYGPFLGLVVVYIGIIFSTFIISKIVKKFGLDLVRDIVPKEKLEKVENIINSYPERVETILFILYFLPVIPKDFLTYIGSLLPITTKRFLIISIFARFPAVFSSTIVGSEILDGDIKTIVIVYVITYSISALITLIYKYKMNKKKKINTLDKTENN